MTPMRGVRVAAVLALFLLFACEDIPLAVGFLAPVPASTRTQQLLLPPNPHVSAVPPSHAERRPCRCRHATAEALTTFNRRDRYRQSQRQRVPVPHRTTATRTTKGVSCRASTEDASSSSPSPDSRPHDSGAGRGAGVGSVASSAVITSSQDHDNEREKEEEEQAEAQNVAGNWSSSTRLIPAATAAAAARATAAADSVVDALGEAVGVSAPAVAAEGGFASTNGLGLVPGDNAPWTEFEDWLLQDTYSRYSTTAVHMIQCNIVAAAALLSRQRCCWPVHCCCPGCSCCVAGQWSTSTKLLLPLCCCVCSDT